MVLRREGERERAREDYIQGFNGEDGGVEKWQSERLREM